MKPRIAVTLGDPSGIGPEIVAKALKDSRVRRVCEPVVTGLRERAVMGRPSRRSGHCAIQALEEAWNLLQTGRAAALVTAPVSKESFNLAGYGYPGHTEWLADRCGVQDPVMLMVSGPMRAVLMTRHVPLAQVSRSLTKRVLVRSAAAAHDFVKRYVAPLPRLVLCGLNPHAGDHGIIGREEHTLFRSALRDLRRRGLRVVGPLPADTAFSRMAEGDFHLALACYHDQGMIPLKVFDRRRIVNVTLGLPIIRTSPGHGTAYDIAGRDKADPEPMIEAILLAARFVRKSRGLS